MASVGSGLAGFFRRGTRVWVRRVGCGLDEVAKTLRVEEERVVKVAGDEFAGGDGVAGESDVVGKGGGRDGLGTDVGVLGDRRGGSSPGSALPSPPG